MKASKSKQNSTQWFEILVEHMTKLRSPQGCAWDRQQSHESLKTYLIEECYEVLAAIDARDSQALKEELGDVLLQVIFHSQLASEAKQFNIAEVIQTLIEKLERRHAHVFSGQRATTAEEAIAHWEKAKAKEKKKSLLESIPLELPALMRAYRLGSKCARVGFDWPQLENVFQKVEEELKEFKAALQEQKTQPIEEEFGDLLFTLAQIARFLKFNPEEALRKSNQKFQKRFEYLEATLKKQGIPWEDCNPESFEALWKQAKSSPDPV